MKERRSYERKLFNSPFEFEMLSGRDLISRTGTFFDIGNGGAGLYTDHMLNEGGILKLYLPASVPDITVPVYAEVMWSQCNDGRCSAGLRFLA